MLPVRPFDSGIRKTDAVDAIKDCNKDVGDGEATGAAIATDVVAATSRDAKISFMAFDPQ